MFAQTRLLRAFPIAACEPIEVPPQYLDFKSNSPVHIFFV
jgi:hypothetical protein